jgi:peptidoglycan/LPS O-acetylase OafA/YrhL
LNDRHRLPTLDGLRAIAVGIVFLSHVSNSNGSPAWLAAVARFFPGDVGVQIFFTISGFIITHLLLREQERNGRIALTAFWLRRALRILPPLIMLLLALQVLDATGWLPVEHSSQWASLFFVRNHMPGGWFRGTSMA